MKKNSMLQSLKLVIHGGIEEDQLSARIEQTYHDALKQALQIGYRKLIAGESSIEVVQQTVRFLEDSPLFNAGFGSVLTQIGTIELDAAIMDGGSLQAGCVAGLSKIANPICLARMVLESSDHMMLVGSHAEQFAYNCSLNWIDSDSLITELQRNKWLERQKNAGNLSLQNKYGTVGAVAIDQYGNLAAGTSTGGLANKHPGRVGDSCIIGAGTYANNNTCAVSTTGQGEYFMRLLTAYDIAAQIEYKKSSLEEAVRSSLKKLTTLGGLGGIIALDSSGKVVIYFNTKGMYRGYIENGTYVTKIYN